MSLQTSYLKFMIQKHDNILLILIHDQIEIW